MKKIIFLEQSLQAYLNLLFIAKLITYHLNSDEDQLNVHLILKRCAGE